MSILGKLAQLRSGIRLVLVDHGTESDIYPVPPDPQTEIGDLIQEIIDTKRYQQPLSVPLHIEVYMALDVYARLEGQKPEIIAAEAVRFYLGLMR